MTHQSTSTSMSTSISTCKSASTPILRPALKLITVLLIIPALFSFIPYQKSKLLNSKNHNHPYLECIVGPAPHAASHVDTLSSTLASTSTSILASLADNTSSNIHINADNNSGTRTQHNAVDTSSSSSSSSSLPADIRIMFGFWIPISMSTSNTRGKMSMNMSKCNLHHPSLLHSTSSPYRRNNGNNGNNDGSWLECDNNNDMSIDKNMNTNTNMNTNEYLIYNHDSLKKWCFESTRTRTVTGTGTGTSTNDNTDDSTSLTFCHDHDFIAGSSTSTSTSTISDLNYVIPSGIYTLLTKYNNNNDNNNNNNINNNNNTETSVNTKTNTHNTHSISITCSNPQYNNPSTSTYYAHQQTTTTKFYPTTTFILLLNIILAFVYWDKNIDPNIVSKQYSKIIYNNQIYRSFTGALAHFEPMHILFNMMTLQSYGNMLEPMLGSVPFLYYNVVLIPLTTVVMMFLIQLQIRYSNSRYGNSNGNNNNGNEQQYAQTSTVGYSGVLFAWAVVSSLESYAVCPIPFVEDMCFQTHEFHIGHVIGNLFGFGSENEFGLGGLVLKFNIGPFIQLLFIHFIMPRTSFVGHLSGIICGFIFHWNLLPLGELFWYPQVLIPFILLLHWRFANKDLIPVKPMQMHRNGSGGGGSGSGNNNDYNNTESSSTGIVTGGNMKEIETQKKNKVLKIMKRLMTCSLLISLFFFDIFGTMVISQILCYIMFHFASVSDNNIAKSQNMNSMIMSLSFQLSLKNKARILWRGTIIALILILVTDALVIPIWFISRVMIYSNHLLCYDLWMEPMVMSFRWMVHFTALIVASNSLHELNSGGFGGTNSSYSDDADGDSKVFYIVFGKVIEWGTDLCKKTFLRSSSLGQSFTAFGGSGFRTGRTLGGHECDRGTSSLNNHRRSRLLMEETV